MSIEITETWGSPIEKIIDEIVPDFLKISFCHLNIEMIVLFY